MTNVKERFHHLSYSLKTSEAILHTVWFKALLTVLQLQTAKEKIQTLLKIYGDGVAEV